MYILIYIDQLSLYIFNYILASFITSFVSAKQSKENVEQRTYERGDFCLFTGWVEFFLLSIFATIPAS